MLISCCALPGLVPAATMDRLDAEALKTIGAIRTLEPGLPDVEVPPAALNDRPLTLERVVQVALANHPTLQSQRENIRFLALDLNSARRDFQPRFRANVAFSQTESAVSYEGERESDTRSISSQTISVSQRLPIGGEVILEAGSSYQSQSDSGDEFAPSAAVALRVPLLRGFGVDYNTESLAQKKRNLVYALRTLGLQEQDLAIRAIDAYLSILSQKQRIIYLVQRREGAGLLFHRSEVFAGLARESELDRLRAEQEYLRSQRDLSIAESDLAARFDSLKLLLNIPVTQPLELAGFDVPVVREVPGEDASVVTALSRRLELLTLIDLIDDTRRRGNFARADLKPDLDFRLRAATASSERSGNASVSEDYTASLVFSLPLDRVRENLNLYDAMQEFIQRERDLATAREGITADVRSALRNLANNLVTIDLQRQIIATAERRTRMAQIRFESGEVSNREVVDADNSLLSEQNYQLDLLQARFMGRLRLARNLGLFNVQDPLGSLPKP